jgi:hypothetical protein
LVSNVISSDALAGLAGLAAAAPKLADPIEILEQIFQARNRDHAVTASLENSEVRIGKDRLRFSLRPSRPGHVYLLMVGTDRTQFWLLFPNAIDKNNRIGANKPFDLPRPTWRMDAAGPPGTNQFIAIVSESPRDFSAAGLKPTDPFAAFALDPGKLADRAGGGSAPVYAGKAHCAGAQHSACPDSYGAAMFSIKEIPAR